MEMCKLTNENKFEPFKSEAHKYIFILLYTDAKNRCDLLGITEEMYYNESLATQWRNNIYYKIYNGDSNLDSLKNIAIDKLNKFYYSMTKED